MITVRVKDSEYKSLRLSIGLLAISILPNPPMAHGQNYLRLGEGGKYIKMSKAPNYFHSCFYKV